MSNLVGIKEEFAIQYDITDVINQFVYGHICYWVNGLQIGDFNSNTIISDVFIFLPQIINDNGKRENELFFRMENEKICYLLGGKAYWDDVKYEEQATEEIWARFDIKIGLDVFRDTMIKLIDNVKRSRIVYVDNNKLLHDFYLERGIVDKVFCCFYKEFNEFYEEHVFKGV